MTSPVTVRLLLVTGALVAISGCRPAREEPRDLAVKQTGGPAASTPAAEPDPYTLRAWTRAVGTKSTDAQTAFDEGLVLAFAFNHGAAERAFRKAAEIDSSLAMPWWGVALVNGPHINNASMSPEQVTTAWEALAKARALRVSSPVDQALIDALGTRYSEAPVADRRPLDEAYANAMREAWTAHPGDPDVGALFAEAMMDLRPWDLWMADGQPQPGTDEILATLDRVLEIAPTHPLANHLLVHAVEGSPHPEKGVAAADRLRTLVPGAGHLVHMPGHIDVRVGRWKDAADANLRAIEADAAWTAKHPEEPGFYRIYMAHDHQFLAFVEMMRGRQASALAAARAMVAGIPPSFLEGPGAAFVDGVLPLPIETMVRFGRWDDVLAEPESPGGLPISKAKRLFARATALTALDRMDEAERERAAFRAAVKALPKDAFVGNNSASAIMAVATNVLDGEMAARRKDWTSAIQSLREAARLEDQLKFDDPPDWTLPVRHSLGAVLLDAGKPADAEAAYREDLVRHPENGWSLFGLEKALRAQGNDADADLVAARYDEAWADAEVEIAASCLCRAPRVVVTLDAVAFMAGHWIAADGSEESWLAPEAGLMLAVSRNLLPRGKVSFEYLRLEQRDDGVVYVASPDGGPTTDFKLMRSEPNLAVFENPEHDFPKRVTYKRDGSKMTARVDDGQDGDKHGFEIAWTLKQ